MTARTKSIIFKIVELIILLSPFIALLIYRREVWFVQKEVVSVSVGFVLCCIVVFAVLKGYAKSIKGIVWSIILFVITFLMKSIIQDLYLILGASTLGLLLSFPFKKLYEENHRVALLVKDEIIKTRVREKTLNELKNVEGENN